MPVLLQIPQRKAPLRTAVGGPKDVSDSNRAAASGSEEATGPICCGLVPLICACSCSKVMHIYADMSSATVGQGRLYGRHLGCIMSCIWHSTSSKSTGSWLRHSVRCSCSS